jgi:hypothetical protein
LITGSNALDSARKIPEKGSTAVRTTKLPEYNKGQIWGALRKAWKGYRIAKVQRDNPRMKEYATRIRTLQGQLGVEKASFPDLGL